MIFPRFFEKFTWVKLALVFVTTENVYLIFDLMFESYMSEEFTSFTSFLQSAMNSFSF